MCVFITIRTQECNIRGICSKAPKDHPSRDKDGLLDVYTRPIIFCKHWDSVNKECKADKRTGHKRIVIFTPHPVPCKACRKQYDEEMKEAREEFTKRFFADAEGKTPKPDLLIPPAWVNLLSAAWHLYEDYVAAPRAKDRAQVEKLFDEAWRERVDEVAERVIAAIGRGENPDHLARYCKAERFNTEPFNSNQCKEYANEMACYSTWMFKALNKEHIPREIINKGNEFWEKHQLYGYYRENSEAYNQVLRAWSARNWDKNEQDWDSPEPTPGTIMAITDLYSTLKRMIPSGGGSSGQGSSSRPQSSSSSSSSNDNKKSSRSSKSHEKKGGHGSSKDNKGKGKDNSGSSGSHRY